MVYIQKLCRMSLESAKKIASITAVNDYLKDNTVVGIGSGSTIIYAVERIAEIVKEKQWNIKCIPTSFQAKQLIHLHKLPLTDLESNPEIDVCFDGADEVDLNFNVLKGGGGCLLQEKIVASCSKELIIVADHTKNSNFIGQQYKKGIPIEVIPMAYIPIMSKIKSLFGGDLTLRMAKCKAGPVVTDNGNFILDWKSFPTDGYDEMNKEILQIPGVVETGLFLRMATVGYFGRADGDVFIRSAIILKEVEK